MIVLWDPELIQLYNDGYVPLLAFRHPSSLGQRTRDYWPEVWHINAPIYDRVFAGETVGFEDALYPVSRPGSIDERQDLYVTLSYSPVRDELGAVKQPLFALLDEWIPESRVLVREEALAELALIYLRGHGSATLRDFVWCAGLKLGGARSGVEATGPKLESVSARGCRTSSLAMGPPSV